MAWTTPATPALAQLVNATVWNPQVRDNLNFLAALATQGYADASVTTTSTSYVTLSGGPTVSGVDLDPGQQVIVVATARCDNDAHTATTGAKISYAISGAGTRAADDTYSAEATGSPQQVLLVDLYAVVNGGTYTFTMNYQRTGASGTAAFIRRKLIVIPWHQT